MCKHRHVVFAGLTSPSPPQEQAPGLTLGCFSTEMSHEFRGSGWNHGTGSLCPPGGPLADSLGHVYIGQLFGLGGISSLMIVSQKQQIPFNGNYFLFLFFDVILLFISYIFGGINISSRIINWENDKFCEKHLKSELRKIWKIDKSSDWNIFLTMKILFHLIFNRIIYFLR